MAPLSRNRKREYVITERFYTEQEKAIRKDERRRVEEECEKITRFYTGIALSVLIILGVLWFISKILDCRAFRELSYEEQSRYSRFNPCLTNFWEDWY